HEGGRIGQQVVVDRRRQRVAPGDHALGGVGPGQLVDLGRHADGHAGPLGQPDDLVEDRRRLEGPVHPHFPDAPPPGGQRLPDGPPPSDLLAAHPALAACAPSGAGPRSGALPGSGPRLPRWHPIAGQTSSAASGPEGLRPPEPLRPAAATSGGNGGLGSGPPPPSARLRGRTSPGRTPGGARVGRTAPSARTSAGRTPGGARVGRTAPSARTSPGRTPGGARVGRTAPSARIPAARTPAAGPAAAGPAAAGPPAPADPPPPGLVAPGTHRPTPVPNCARPVVLRALRGLSSRPVVLRQGRPRSDTSRITDARSCRSGRPRE